MKFYYVLGQFLLHTPMKLPQTLPMRIFLLVPSRLAKQPKQISRESLSSKIAREPYRRMIITYNLENKSNT